MHPYVPFEIVISILSNLDWRTLVRCSAVCRFWQHVVRDTLSLQYKIELGANGLVDGPASKLTIPERLHLLRERKHAWDTLGFRRCSVIPTPGECHAYELVGGVFAKAMNPYNDVGSAFALNPGSRHFTFLSLPGKGREPDMIVWNDAGILCRDFGVDPTQDLIALVEQPDAHKPSITVHLRTIPLNERHPAAAVPILSQPMRSSFDGAEIQICDDIIAILVRVHSIPRLVIWQWTSGKLLVSETFCSQSLRSMDDFSLLSNYAFMMTSRFPQGSIKVYTFRTPNGREPLCGPAKLSDLRCTTLYLPPLQPNNHYAELSTHTSPFTARIPAGVPFATSEDVRVHVMSVLTQPTQPPHSSSDSELGNTATGHAASFVVVMLNRALLKYADRNLASSESGYQKNVDMSWDEWGPRNTRWFSERSTHAWQRYVHGSRIVRTLHNAWPSTRCRMQVMDFCVHPLHPRAADDQAMEDMDAAEPDVPYTHRLVTKPSVMRDRTVFRGGGVESRLPYREVTLKKELGPYSGFMIDEERVIGLSAMAFANGDMKQVDVFTF
ncbi:uncharacterized protein FOMMEDRAFT_142765 [Fomitiporia mediterranea MF3/22]|uniref:uncharacterized protein n=1 Tax=Fomitiporia mediterranea (strain MF3/22) TaxID=694068 RepID=UPI0004408505|nr:uncharacterized protein FOMMEDRAFT_142765 [Fomitiporia mediterranea MF3/22]EJC99542.1 hypothetical protein FOMMEDRAFT_142765 [Fomitiporia mediterranea MF3/22]